MCQLFYGGRKGKFYAVIGLILGFHLDSCKMLFRLVMYLQLRLKFGGRDVYSLETSCCKWIKFTLQLFYTLANVHTLSKGCDAREAIPLHSKILKVTTSNLFWTGRPGFDFESQHNLTMQKDTLSCSRSSASKASDSPTQVHHHLNLARINI